jgi:hypothetical protein
MKLGSNWQFTAAVANADDQSVTWSIQEGATAGAISAAGVYTAPSVVGAYHVIATSKADSSKSATAIVNVGTTGFTSIGKINVSRYGHTATLLPSGKVYIGGGAIDSTVLDEGLTVIEPDELFDPATGTSQPAGKLQRTSHTATVLQNGDILFTGGIVDETQDGYVLSATAMLLRTASGLLQPTGSMSLARYAHSATLLRDGRVLVTGGTDSIVGSTATKTTEVYDPSSGAFTPVGDMAAARGGHFATLLPNGKVLITGGYAYGSEYISTAELFDPATNSFSSAGNTFSGPVAAATLLADGRVLITGETSTPYAPAAELYDPATGNFTPTGTLSVLRFGYTATLLADGTVLVAGGFSYGGGPESSPTASVALTDSEIYNLATGVFTKGPTMRSAREAHTATPMPDGSVLFLGGKTTPYGINGLNGGAEIYQ